MVEGGWICSGGDSEMTNKVVSNAEPNEPEFVEKRFFWGLCYGLLDVKRMAAVIIRGEGPEIRKRAKEELAGVSDGHLAMDGYTMEIQQKIRKWGIPG